MKVLLSLALLLWLGADAYYTPRHHQDHLNLQRSSEINVPPSPWIDGETHRYYMTYNMTAGIPGKTSQVAKSLIQMTVLIRAKGNSHYLMMAQDVSVNKPLSSVPSPEDDLPMQSASDLETDLKKPISFIYENGKITSYTLGQEESFQSVFIKRSILRDFEMKIEESDGPLPIVYTDYATTEEDEMGTYNVYYGITVSPDPHFPLERNVLNISKTVDSEPFGYPTTFGRDNFFIQGCPGVCQLREDPKYSDYNSGCPGGYEPYQMPLKKTKVIHHNYGPVGDKIALRHIRVEESSVAQMYGQDMHVHIESLYRIQDLQGNVPEPENQVDYKELNTVPTMDDIKRFHPPSRRAVTEEYYKWVYGVFSEKIRAEEMKELAKNLLVKVSETVLAGNIESNSGQRAAEDVAKFREVLALLRLEELKDLWNREVIPIRSLRSASEKEKIKRQIFLDIIPLCGTLDSIKLIREKIIAKEILRWEAKEILDAISENVIDITEDHIRYLQDIAKSQSAQECSLVYSSAIFTISDIYRELCITNSTQGNVNVEDQPVHRRTKPRNRHMKALFSRWDDQTSDDETESEFGENSAQGNERETGECDITKLEEYLQEMKTKLESARTMKEKVIYIHAIARLGYVGSLDVLKPYAYGLAEDIFDYAPGDIDFIKSITIYALHHTALNYPEETMELAIPVYFNRTEVPIIRNAAFSIVMRCGPSIEFLQHLAVDSWHEPSREVGSYVYSVLQTIGNASTPCLRETAYRVRSIISQVKDYDIGWQYSKKIVKTFFDELSNFGTEMRFGYVQNNESAISSNLYSSLHYNIQAMRDVFFQVGSHIQGVNIRDLLKIIDEQVLDIFGSKLPFKLPPVIPRSEYQAIFQGLNLIPRLPKELRIAVYKKIFYTTSFIYVDKESIQDIITPVMEFVKNYFDLKNGNNGHYVKTFIPSSIQTMTYSNIGMPVVFQMQNPLILSLKVEKKPQSSCTYSTSFYIRPCVYFTHYIKKSIFNVAGGNAYGVYQKQRYTFTFPYELSVSKSTESGALQATFKIPHIPKQIYRHKSEAGTFETELTLRKFYGDELNKEIIKTIPVLFKRERTFKTPGVPGIRLQYENEDIQDKYLNLIRNPVNITKMIIDEVMNPVWMRKDVVVSLTSGDLPSLNQIIYRMTLNRTVMIGEQNSEEQPRSRGTERSWFRRSEERDEDSDDEDVSRKSWQHESKFRRQEEKQSRWQEEKQSRWQEEEQPERQEKEQRKFQQRGKTEDCCEKTGQVYYEFSVKAETRCLERPVAELKVEYTRSLDRMNHIVLAKTRVHTADRRDPLEVCSEFAMHFGKSSNEFYYDPSIYTSPAAKFRVGITAGDECKPIPQCDIFAEGELRAVPPKDFFEENEFYENPPSDAFLPEMNKQCIEDVRQGKPQSPICLSAMTDKSQFNKLLVHVITKTQLPAKIQNITSKLERAIEDHYYTSVDINPLVNNPSNSYELEINYIDKLTHEPVLDIFFKKPQKNILFHRIHQKYLQPVSSIFSSLDTFLLSQTNNTYPPSCTLMENYVRTYDMKVFPMPRSSDSCRYVLSTHCAKESYFAVIAQPSSTQKTAKDIEIYVSDQKVQLQPPTHSGKTYRIVHNGKQLEVTPDSSILLDETTMLYVHLIPVHSHGKLDYLLRVEVENIGLNVLYDGINTKVQVNPLYKGELCGLCSEFDGEITGEYRGPDQCLYLKSMDFAHSSVTNPDACQDTVSPSPVPRICFGGEQRSWPRRGHHFTFDEEDSEDTEERSVRPIERTLTVEKRGHTCFTTEPVPVCDEGSQPVQEYPVRVGFHCLPKDDFSARRLLNDSKHRVLTELSSKKVDFTETVRGARSCSP